MSACVSRGGEKRTLNYGKNEAFSPTRVSLRARAEPRTAAAPALRRDSHRRSWRRRASRDGIDIGAPRLQGDVGDQVRVRLIGLGIGFGIGSGFGLGSGFGFGLGVARPDLQDDVEDEVGLVQPHLVHVDVLARGRGRVM